MKENNRLEAVKEKYKGIILRQATLIFLLRDGEILLAMKKRGFAAGKWNGSGGKSIPTDKSIEETAIRETSEELGVTAKNLKHAATLNFYFDGAIDWSQQVIVYTTREWEGDPIETEEMAPKWFPINEIPFNLMWEDDGCWLPRILAGQKLIGDFLFDKNQNMLEYKIKNV